VSTVDVLLAVCKALTPEQQDMIVTRFVKLNPGWNGAETPQVLQALNDNDALLAEMEPWYDANPDLADIDGVGVALLALLWSAPEGQPADLAPGRVRDLLDRAGMDLS
jgi:hypothetical protein